MTVCLSVCHDRHEWWTAESDSTLIADVAHGQPTTPSDAAWWPISVGRSCLLTASQVCKHRQRLGSPNNGTGVPHKQDLFPRPRQLWRPIACHGQHCVLYPSLLVVHAVLTHRRQFHANSRKTYTTDWHWPKAKRRRPHRVDDDGVDDLLVRAHTCDLPQVAVVGY
jgi:hypothetical protein